MKSRGNMTPTKSRNLVRAKITTNEGNPNMADFKTFYIYQPKPNLHKMLFFTFRKVYLVENKEKFEMVLH